MDMPTLDETSFAAACRAVQAQGRADQGVGTLGEKTLHAVLKRMIEPDPAFHEVKVGSFVADVLREGHIFEVQTRSVHRLKPKLSALLPYYPVTVVLPILEEKWLINMDRDTGELLTRRKSPKVGRPAGALPELVYLKAFLKDPHFSLLLVLMAGEEVRLLTGDRRHPAVKLELAPTAFRGAMAFMGPRDYAVLVPKGLPEEFSAEELGRAMKLPKAGRSAAANVLSYLGVIERAGSRGRAYLYKVPKEE